MFAPVEVDLTGQVLFVEKCQYSLVLHDAKTEEPAVASNSARQAARSRQVFEVIREALLGKLLGPGKRVRFGRLDSSQRVPDSRKIRFAVGRAGRRPGRSIVRSEEPGVKLPVFPDGSK